MKRRNVLMECPTCERTWQVQMVGNVTGDVFVDDPNGYDESCPYGCDAEGEEVA